MPSLSFNAFLPYILQPTRIINYSNTFVDNIFLNDIDPDIISGNLAAPISDHLPQYAIIPNMFGNISGNKSNIYERDWLKFDLHFKGNYTSPTKNINYSRLLKRKANRLMVNILKQTGLILRTYGKESIPLFL